MINRIKNSGLFRKTGLALSGCLLLGGLACNAQVKEKKGGELSFKKQVLTRDFISEGATVADVNKDGKKDVIAGAFWFEAPSWTAHELAPPQKFIVNGGYSNSFLNWTMDVNQDGWPDVIRIDFPGKAAVWHENPKNQPGHWKMHTIHASVGNESPLFTDVDGDGRADIICNDPEAKEIIWLRAPSKKGSVEWERFVISKGDKIEGTERYTHGLGFGDINGDKRPDVVIAKGWWEAPADPKQANWTFHPADLGEGCSQMYVMDLNGDGLKDVISASAHDYGIWWHEQGKDAEGKPTWKTHDIYKAFSQTHGMALTDLNRDKQPDLITGKRYYAHHGHDPGASEPAVLYWFEYKPGKTPTWIPHEIDNDSGVGLQVDVEDINGDGLKDIIVANKKGVHVFEQQKSK